MRFTLRDLLWLVLVIAGICGWLTQAGTLAGIVSALTCVVVTFWVALAKLN
jgi:hypothetical protein